MDAAPLTRLPAVDQVLRAPAGIAAVERHGRLAATAAIRATLAAARAALREAATAEPPTPAALAENALAALAAEARPTLCPVLNLTGTVLHTNLGRALLAEAAIDAATAAMRHPVALEYDLAAGARGERDDHVRALLRELTGAEDALVVNNNAAALVLVLAGLAAGRPTVVSRGELIEIGGSFRLPDIMAAAGTILREVGTTNRTHARDYEAAAPDAALLLKVHTSNYRIQGFHAEVAPRDLAAIARAHGVPLVDDLGSGTLTDLAAHGLPRERTVQDALRDGADLVTFSGDKLLGGPQAGFVVGRADLVKRLAKHPLKRALRLDKLRLAALAATLRLYRDPDRLAERLPTLRHLARPRAEIAARAGRLAPALAAWAGADWRVTVEDCASEIGSGALPLETLPSAALVLRAATGRGGGALEALAARLRALPTPVIGRIAGDALRLDLRCLDDDAALAAALA